MLVTSDTWKTFDTQVISIDKLSICYQHYRLTEKHSILGEAMHKPSVIRVLNWIAAYILILITISRQHTQTLRRISRECLRIRKYDSNQANEGRIAHNNLFERIEARHQHPDCIVGSSQSPLNTMTGHAPLIQSLWWAKRESGHCMVLLNMNVSLQESLPPCFVPPCFTCHHAFSGSSFCILIFPAWYTEIF